MIEYPRECFNLPLLVHGFHGSCFLRALPKPLLSTAFAIYLWYYPSHLKAGAGRPGIQPDDTQVWRDPSFRNTYPFAVFFWLVGFTIIYRVNFSYNRWWEARRWLQSMTHRWSEVYLFASTWDAGSVMTPEQELLCSAFRQRLMHLVSLMHTVALLDLRNDKELTNVFPHRASFKPEYPSGCFAKADNFKQYRDVMESDAVDSLGAFVATIKSVYSAFHLSNWNAKNFNAAHPLPVVGGLNEMERGALNGLQQSKSTARAHGNLIGRNVRRSIEIADDPKFKDPLLDAAASFTHDSLERLFWLQTQIHWIIVKRRDEGGINVSAPEVSRIWQVLYSGTNGYMQCRKIVDTPFPFNLAQLLVISLLGFSILCPILMVSYISEIWLSLSLNFIAVWLYNALNEVCRELEDPFSYAPNDHPLQNYAFDFNERLLAIEHANRANLHFTNTQTHSHGCVSVLCLARAVDDDFQKLYKIQFDLNKKRRKSRRDANVVRGKLDSEEAQTSKTPKTLRKISKFGAGIASIVGRLFGKKDEEQGMAVSTTTNLSKRTPPKAVSNKTLPKWGSPKWGSAMLKSPLSLRGVGMSQTKGGSRGVDALDLQVYSADDVESERDISDHGIGIDWAAVGNATSPRDDLQVFRGKSQSFDVSVHGSGNPFSQLYVATQPVKDSKKVKVKKLKLDSRYGRSKGLKKQLKKDDDLKTMMLSEKQRRRDEKQRMKERNESARTGQRLSVTVAAGSTGLGEAVGIALEVQKIRTKRLELMFATMDTSPDVLGEELPADDEDSGPSSLISPDASLRGRRGEPNPSPMSRPSVDITRADLDLRKMQEELEDLLRSRPETQVDGGQDLSQNSGGRYSGIFGPMGVHSSVPSLFRNSPNISHDSLVDHSASGRDRRNPQSPIRSPRRSGVQRTQLPTSMSAPDSPFRSLPSPPLSATRTVGYGSASNFLDDADDAGEGSGTGPEDGSQSPVLRYGQPQGK